MTTVPGFGASPSDPFGDLDDPAAGDPATIREIAGLHRASAARWNANAHAFAAAEVWFDGDQAEAVDAVEAQATHLAPPLQTLSDSHSSAAAALEVFAAAIDDIAGRSGRLRADVDSSLADIARTREALGDLGGGRLPYLTELHPSSSLYDWPAGPPLLPAYLIDQAVRDGTLTAADVTALHAGVRRWRALLGTIDTCRASYAALSDTRASANDACAAALENTPLNAAVTAARAGAPPVSEEAAVASWLALSPTLFTATYATDPDAAIRALETATPDVVASIWATLPAAFIAALISRNPAAVGNLEGARYRDRNTANVARLTGEHDATVRQIAERSEVGGAALLKERLRVLDYLIETYGDGRAAQRLPPEFLVRLDTTPPGEPYVVVTIGDPGTASNTGTVVSGMGSGSADIKTYRSNFSKIVKDADDSAVLLSFNYRTPSADLSVLTPNFAIAGAPRLGRELDGLRAVQRAITGSRSVLIGHSYGATTSAAVLAQDSHGVDAFAAVGPAGFLAGTTLSELHISPDNVFVAIAKKDPWASPGQTWSGRINPTLDDWGAVRFGTEGTRLADGTTLLSTTGHDFVEGSAQEGSRSYTAPGTESARNIAHILAGDPDRLTPGSATYPHPLWGTTPDVIEPPIKDKDPQQRFLAPAQDRRLLNDPS
ncbi:alpha/beta hydrolase [Okibacterium fritillariae]|uniref:alpha/beta hydrolase n=1 Tax=Okibacterium fritillariae TaxID=123320 RepID=UPI00405549C3